MGVVILKIVYVLLCYVFSYFIIKFNLKVYLYFYYRYVIIIYNID